MSTTSNFLLGPRVSKTTRSKLNVFSSSCSSLLLSLQLHQVVHPSSSAVISSLVSSPPLFTPLFHPSHPWHFHKETHFPSSRIMTVIWRHIVDRARHGGNSLSRLKGRRNERSLKPSRSAAPGAALYVRLLSKLLLLLHKGGDCQALRFVLLTLLLTAWLLMLAVLPPHLLHGDVVVIAGHLLGEVNFYWRL